MRSCAVFVAVPVTVSFSTPAVLDAVPATFSVRSCAVFVAVPVTVSFNTFAVLDAVPDTDSDNDSHDIVYFPEYDSVLCFP